MRIFRCKAIHDNNSITLARHIFCEILSPLNELRKNISHFLKRNFESDRSFLKFDKENWKVCKTQFDAYNLTTVYDHCLILLN